MGTKVASPYLRKKCKMKPIKYLEMNLKKINGSVNWTTVLIFGTDIATFFKKFNKLLIDIHENIQFTVETNEKEHLLDVLIIKENTNNSTDLFDKKTDGTSTFLFNSCQPAHMKRSNILFNMTRRICTIVPDEERRNKKFLCRHKYPEAIRNAKQKLISELRIFNRDKTPGNSPQGNRLL